MIRFYVNFEGKRYLVSYGKDCSNVFFLGKKLLIEDEVSHLIPLSQIMMTSYDLPNNGNAVDLAKAIKEETTDETS